MQVVIAALTILFVLGGLGGYFYVARVAKEHDRLRAANQHMHRILIGVALLDNIKLGKQRAGVDSLRYKILENREALTRTGAFEEWEINTVRHLVRELDDEKAIGKA